MKTIELNLYSFEELNERAKAKALKVYQDLNVDHGWWEFTYDDFIEICTYLGIAVNKKSIHFEGFYSQGNGSSFSADVQLTKLLTSIQMSPWQNHAPDVEFDFSLPIVDKRVLALIERGKIDLNARIIARQRGYGVVVDFGNYPVDYPFKNYDCIYGELDELEKWLDTIAKKLNHFLYKQLEKEYEYQISDEAVAEMIKINEYQFLSDGSIANSIEKFANQ